MGKPRLKSYFFYGLHTQHSLQARCSPNFTVEEASLAEEKQWVQGHTRGQGSRGWMEPGCLEFQV